jgi:hypothetical protein
MESPQPNLDNLPPQENTISMADAIGRAAVWRSVLGNLINSGSIGRDGGGSTGGEQGGSMGGDGGWSKLEDELPKCLHIPFAELFELVDDYKNAGVGLSGVRLYLTFHNNNADNRYHITGFLVPTINIASGKESTNVGPEVHKDYIIPVRLKQSTGNSNGDPNGNSNGDLTGDSTGVSIYDFTLPCPIYCSGTSDELTGNAGVTADQGR